MSNPKEMDSCIADTQETCKSTDENSQMESFHENQNASWNESQDFRLIVEGEESVTDKVILSTEDEANRQDSAEQSNPQQTLNVSQTNEKVMTTNDEETKSTRNEKVTGNENVNIFSDVDDSERKDELSDEDEIIQATPPRSHSPTRKGSDNIDVTSLKRKAGPIDELSAKIPRTVSIMENITDTEKRLEEEEEESRQSEESNDSYQNLLKNIDRNVVIEETQDPTDQEFTQNSSTSPLKRTIDDDEIEIPRHSDQMKQQEEIVSEKCCSMEKDENLNVSAKLTDVSLNDSTVVDVNSTNENDSRVEDSDLPIEATKNVDSTVADEKSAIETDKCEEINKEIVFDESSKTERANSIEKVIDDDEKISSTASKLQTSVELIYESVSQTADDDENKSKLDVVEIDENEIDKTIDTSAEVIYDRKNTKQEPEVVEILDVSQEDCERTCPELVPNSDEGSEIRTIDKSSIGNKSSVDFSHTESMKESSLDSRALTIDSMLVNGSLGSKKNDNDITLSIESDTLSGYDPSLFTKTDSKIDNAKISSNVKSSSFKDPDNIELISLSDHDISNVEAKSDRVCNNASTKIIQVEREVAMYVKLKYVIHVDESTKEHVNKEVTVIHCEPAIIESTMGRQKNEDSQSSLADISDNKDSPSGSVNSNPQLYSLNPSRLSCVSSISSSSVSSAATLGTRLGLKTHFPPLGSAKYAKKLPSQESPLIANKSMLGEIYDRVTREWKNHHLMTATILNYANMELGAANTAGSIELIDHRNPHLRDTFVRSSTPAEEVVDPKIQLTITPKSTKKGKAVKRPRSKMVRSNVAQTNGNEDIANINTVLTRRASSGAETDAPSERKKIRLEIAENKLDADVLVNSPSLRNCDSADELIGKSVFAKWSDNSYYPGIVSDRIKTKYKVNFYDGKSKMLISEFVIPIPKTLRNGLSVYALYKDYGSPGYLLDSFTSTTMSNGVDNSVTYYTVELDGGDRVCVQLRDIFLSTDQARVLKEEIDSTDKHSLPSTPKTLGQVTLDNMVDGKRRSKRIGTPVFSTPKSRNNGTNSSSSKSKFSEPSVSGVSVRLKDTLSTDISSDSNVESTPMDSEFYDLRGVQKEIVGTPYAKTVKGSQHRIKGKSRSKKRVDDPQIVAKYGPIPPSNSNIFKGMSFILTYILTETLDRYKDIKTAVSSVETEATDTETENEEDWTEPFDRNRLCEQIRAGGGKIYDKFDTIPKEEYKNTKLITNVPNRTEKYILCLSVGILACNHKWIIRCCSEGKIVNAAENALPTGWSLQKRAYIEMFQADESKPLKNIVVIIPNLIFDDGFAVFWGQVCENAGAVVLIPDNLEAMKTMDFDDKVIVLSNKKCPSWAVERSNRFQIPILSPMWVTQCLIEGKFCPYNQHPSYKYNYVPN